MASRKLGRWIVGETLGKGGFSKVRLGVDEQTGERVALKILKKKEMGINADVIKQVEREIHAMQSIQHPNVIQLKHVEWECTYTKKNGARIPVILVVLELATGGELFDFLAFTGPFEEAIARAYFHQLIAGIAHCHAKGIAHRDLKPENLLLSSDFVLKVADFGFAAPFVSASGAALAMYTECGTPSYMAPEVLSKGAAAYRAGYDGAGADLWSAGVVLFITLAGFPPFQRPSLQDWWFHKLSHGKHHLFWEAHQRTAYFSDLVKDFLNKLLCPDPARRMRLEELVKHPWFLGPSVSHGALSAELTRRKNTVDENKLRERAEKAGAKVGGAGAGEDAAIPAQAGLLERGDVSMTRGEAPVAYVNPEGEELPPAVPSMTSFGKDVAHVAGVGDAHACGAESAHEDEAAAAAATDAVLSADAFSFGAGGGLGGGEGGEYMGGERYEPDGLEDDDGPGACAASSAPAAASASASAAAASADQAPMFPLDALASFTRFSSRLPARALLARIHTTLTTLGCASTLDEAQFRIKRARCVTSVGVIDLSVHVFQDPRDSNERIVDFKRRSPADSAPQFRVLYAEIRHHLRDVISDSPSETMRQ